jgi:hypothetical protein
MRSCKKNQIAQIVNKGTKLAKMKSNRVHDEDSKGRNHTQPEVSAVGFTSCDLKGRCRSGSPSYSQDGFLFDSIALAVDIESASKPVHESEVVEAIHEGSCLLDSRCVAGPRF